MSSQSNPLISFIIPVYNRKEKLKRAIDSVLVSPFTDYEIILIDDASTDGTREYCQSYAELDSRFHCILLDENHGPGYARNCGFQHAKGQWIYCLDSDDVLISESLPRIAEMLQREFSKVPIVFVDSIWVTENDSQSYDIYLSISYETSVVCEINEFWNKYSAATWTTLWQCIISTDFLNYHSLHCPETYYHEDIVLISKILNIVDSVGICAVPMVQYTYLSSDSLGCSGIRRFPFETVKMYLELYKLYSTNSKNTSGVCAMERALFRSMIICGVRHELKYDPHARPIKDLISEIFTSTIENIPDIYYTELFSAYYRELLKTSLFLFPAGQVHVLLAKRLLDCGGTILGLIDNNRGSETESVIDEYTNLNIFTPKQVAERYPGAYVLSLWEGKPRINFSQMLNTYELREY